MQQRENFSLSYLLPSDKRIDERSPFIDSLVAGEKIRKGAPLVVNPSTRAGVEPPLLDFATRQSRMFRSASTWVTCARGLFFFWRRPLATVSLACRSLNMLDHSTLVALRKQSGGPRVRVASRTREHLPVFGGLRGPVLHVEF